MDVSFRFELTSEQMKVFSKLTTEIAELRIAIMDMRRDLKERDNNED